MTGVAAAEKLARRGCRAAAAPARRPQAAAPLTSSTWAASASRRAVTESVVASADRTLPASTCWVSRDAGRGGPRLRDGGGEHRRDQQGGQHLPHPRSATRPAGRRRARRSRGRRGIAGVEMVGQQRAQQRRHRDQRRRARLVRIAAGVGVVAAERPRSSMSPADRLGLACRRRAALGSATDCTFGIRRITIATWTGTARPTTGTCASPRSETPSRRPARRGSTARPTAPAGSAGTPTSARTSRPCRCR